MDLLMFQVSNFIKIGIFKKVKIDGYNIIKHWKEMENIWGKIKEEQKIFRAKLARFNGGENKLEF